jgi:hypothetical protein
MSFGAMAPWQAWLLLAAAGALAAWLFLLKVRPPRVQVASLLLWRRVLDEAREQTWWERVRKAISLAAAILIAVLLAIAVTRPGPRVTASSRGRMLLVLDSSWSMLARTASGETRWERAVDHARAMAASAAGDPIAIATTADGLIEGPTPDSALIETTLERLEPSGAEGAAWPRVGGGETVHFFTDGAVPRTLDPSVIVHSVHDPAPNVAIIAFVARPAASADAKGAAYLEVANYSAAPQSVRVTVTRGTAGIFSETIQMAAGEAVRQIVPLEPQGDPRLHARVTASEDALPLDDTAAGWMPDADPLDLVVVSADPAPWSALFSRAPGMRATVVAEGAYQPGAEDVVIFDRVTPAAAPSRPALLIAPRAADWIGSFGPDERQPRWSYTGAHPLLAGVDAHTLDIRRAAGFEGSGWDVIARSENGTALVAVSETRDRRLALLTFAISDSNLARAAAFPVLVGNAVEWLARPALQSPRHPGLARLPGSTRRVIAPDGAVLPLLRAGPDAIAVLQAPGLYLVEGAGSRSVVAVNAGDPVVSSLTRSALQGQDAAGPAEPGRSGRPWWLYAVAAAFVLAAAEWWTWLRRVTV